MPASAHTASVNYTQIGYTFTITSAHGTVTKNPDKATYHAGDVVELTVAPAAGWAFVNWSGDATGSSNPVSVTINGNTAVTANYTQNGYSLTITSEHGTVTKSPDQASYHYGDVVELTAKAAPGWMFVNWSGGASGTANPVSVTINGDTAVTANFDHNGADTTGVFRPSNGALYLKNKNITGYADVAINYGLPGDYPIVGDWDGDGDATIGIFRNGTFYLRNNNTIGYADVVFAFGVRGDQPVAGDWDGDGIDTIGVYRNGLFLLRNSNDAGPADASFALGMAGDVGIAGDWNGDGKDTTGVFRPTNGALYLKNQNVTGYADIQINYGLAGDKPVVGDWDNNGTDTIGVYRNGTFMLRNSNTIGYAEMVFALGVPGDMPIAGNWDGLP
jgi:NOL1/NOP2/fmu family ribosome biogenesis protein